LVTALDARCNTNKRECRHIAGYGHVTDNTEYQLFWRNRIIERSDTGPRSSVEFLQTRISVPNRISIATAAPILLLVLHAKLSAREWLIRSPEGHSISQTPALQFVTSASFSRVSNPIPW
jgi:hypothetical protein